MTQISYSEYYSLDEETRESLYGRAEELDVSIISAIDEEWQRIQSELPSVGIPYGDLCFDLPSGSPVLRSESKKSLTEGVDTDDLYFRRLEDNELYEAQFYWWPDSINVDGLKPLIPQFIDAFRAESDRLKALADRLSALQKKESL